MNKLLDKRTSMSAGAFPKLVKCTWPLGRVVLFQDRIVLDARAEKWELLYSDVDCFQFNFMQVNIEHHDPDVIADISINGILISRSIREAIARHGLPIRIG